MIGPRFTEVLDAARAGDERAFASIWTDLHPPVLRYLRMLDPVAAEDLAAETFISVARGLARFDGDEQDFRAWVFTIARRREIDHRRKTARRPRTEPLEPELDVVDGQSAEDDAIAATRTTEALRLIGQLSSDQAEVVLLRVVAGLDVARVAEIMERSPGATRVLQHRALQRLSAIVGDQGSARASTGGRTGRA